MAVPRDTVATKRSRNPMPSRFLALALLLLVPLTAARAESRGPENLLALPSARIEQASDPGAAGGVPKALLDGDARTAVTYSAGDGAPLILVFGFAGNTVAPEWLEITLGAAEGADQAPAGVDLLVSTLSPHTGFHSVRSDPLKGGTSLQKFAFPSVGARWVMLKISPAPRARHVRIADVRIMGREGPPQSRYRFKEAPARALDVLQQIQQAGALKLTISADEASLFADAARGKLDRWTFAEAALLASGLTSAEQRKPYLDRLAAVEADARKAVAAASGPLAKGEALLKFLHAGPLSKGYLSRQTDVTGILDTGRFNCVSSAALYNILGRRLGLDLRAIEVPDHAFSILYDGTAHADVETTTASGFNPSRNKSAQAEFEKLTGFAYIPDSHRDQRREVGELGLVAIIYYNHGVELSREKRYPEALLAYFRAMSLDPEFTSAVNNALAMLANWSHDLARQQRFEEALGVAALGLRLAPQDAALVNNHKAVWSMWADALMKGGKNDEAIALLRRADRALPGQGFARMQAWVVIREGEEQIKAGNWQKAASAAAAELVARLDQGAQQEVAEWAASVPHRWAQSETRQGRYARALDILEARRAAAPHERRVLDHLAYVVQEHLAAVAKQEGAEAAEKLLSGLLRRFAGVGEIRRVAEAHLQRSATRLLEEGRYEQALGSARRIGELIGDAKRGDEALGAVYDRWALKLAKDKQFDAALGVYEKALAELADKRNAENNVRYIIQEWLKDAAAAQGTAATIDILKRQLPRFAGVRDLGQLAVAHAARTVRDLSARKQFSVALATLDELAPSLKQDQVAEVAASIYDRWAEEVRSKGDWQGAVDVYQRALQRFPTSRHLETNAVATFYQWSKTHMDRKDWRSAIAVYEKALERFPGHSVLTQNLRYCREQLERAEGGEKRP